MIDLLLATLLISEPSGASGMPVVDTNQLIADLRDSAYLVDSVSELVEEVGLAGEEMQYLVALEQQMNGLSSDLQNLQNYNKDVADLGNYDRMRGVILADRIRSFTQYLRKLKRVVSTALAIQSRPQAMLVTLQMLENSRQRENDKMQAKLMAAAELEKVNETRLKVRREIERQEQFHHEKDLIFNKIGNKQVQSPLQVQLNKPKNEGKGLL